MTLEECRAECLKNCSCTAYTNSNISRKGSGCLIWFGDLIDIQEFIDDSFQTIYIWIWASELGNFILCSSYKKFHKKTTIWPQPLLYFLYYKSGWMMPLGQYFRVFIILRIRVKIRTRLKTGFHFSVLYSRTDGWFQSKEETLADFGGCIR